MYEDIHIDLVDIEKAAWIIDVSFHADVPNQKEDVVTNVEANNLESNLATIEAKIYAVVSNPKAFDVVKVDAKRIEIKNDPVPIEDNDDD